MSEPLKECPFCGGEPELKYVGDGVPAIRHSCLDDVLYMSVERWQTRPTPAPLSKGDKLQRYGITWTEGDNPILTPMPDGYWTPWHLAVEALTPSPVAVDAKAGETTDKDCYVHQPLGKDPEFDAWEKLHDPQQYESRLLRTKLSSERAMHKAWRKRAEEAEAALTAPKPDSKE